MSKIATLPRKEKRTIEITPAQAWFIMAAAEGLQTKNFEELHDMSKDSDWLEVGKELLDVIGKAAENNPS